MKIFRKEDFIVIALVVLGVVVSGITGVMGSWLRVILIGCIVLAFWMGISLPFNWRSNRQEEKLQREIYPKFLERFGFSAELYKTNPREFATRVTVVMEGLGYAMGQRARWQEECRLAAWLHRDYPLSQETLDQQVAETKTAWGEAMAVLIKVNHELIRCNFAGSIPHWSKMQPYAAYKAALEKR